MSKAIFILNVLLIPIGTYANVNFIDISKISSDSKLVTAFNYIRDNQQYYDHWTTDWSYDKPKEELISKLRDIYSLFSSIANKNEELNLLLGDIAHYCTSHSI